MEPEAKWSFFKFIIYYIYYCFTISFSSKILLANTSKEFANEFRARSENDLIDECLIDKVEKQEADIVETLIDRGADVNSTGTRCSYHKGFSVSNKPLYLACMVKKPNLKLVDLLIKNGAKLNPNPENYVHTPLHIACMADNPSIKLIEKLIIYGVIINQNAELRWSRSDNCLDLPGNGSSGLWSFTALDITLLKKQPDIEFAKAFLKLSPRFYYNLYFKPNSKIPREKNDLEKLVKNKELIKLLADTVSANSKLLSNLNNFDGNTLEVPEFAQPSIIVEEIKSKKYNQNLINATYQHLPLHFMIHNPEIVAKTDNRDLQRFFIDKLCQCDDVFNNIFSCILRYNIKTDENGKKNMIISKSFLTHLLTELWVERANEINSYRCDI